MAFKPIDPKVDIQKLELDQLEYWRLHRVFQRTTEGREDRPKFVFYEGPPTANGKPGSHHVLARAFKDMFPRYKVMRGYYCERRGGWDTHGLPVELAVEKELGITDKRQIEEFGIAAFNERCRKSVFANIRDWEKQTERIGYWVDLDNAYVTFTNEYIESVWWVLQQLWNKGLIYRGYKVVPYSPSSGTVLSSHEVALGYKEVSDPSVYVRFPLRDRPGVYFLAWTTTPWTLPANAALAVGPDVEYVQVEVALSGGDGTEQLILAEARLKEVMDKLEYRIVKRMRGRDLVRERYKPLYTFLPTDKDYAYVIPGDFVSTEEGTGIVHLAPAFGADDMEMGIKYDLPVFMTMAPNGRFIDAVDKFKGMWFKDADTEIIKDLKDRGLMFKSGKYKHTYPHNWRDGKPLMYMARDTWFIRTTEYKDKLIAHNKRINWVPAHIRDGRFGNWLEDLKDWALGRERYWGTPLPVWVDDKTGEMICVGSVRELSQLAGRDLSNLDLHRPYVDEITFPNPNGRGGIMRRVPEVIDVWFDSGAMQVAQYGYPHKPGSRLDHPADYICEAVDQTRGWFYSLHAISTMLFDDVAFKNVICLGHILDEKGEKMSKSKGNIVDPWQVLNTYGADAFRWYMYTASQPGESRRFSVDLVGSVVGKFYNTLWNTYSFFVTYANIDGWTPAHAAAAPPVSERDWLDRWILASLHRLVKNVTDAYETYDVLGATRPIEAFVDELSNWYVRRSRRRFWKSENDTDKASAYATLYECLVTLSKLIAPAMPFLSEAMYRNLVVEQDSKAPDSVHLAEWPGYEETLIDEGLIEEMALVQQLVSLGLSARNSVEMGVRQPLASISFGVGSARERAIVEQYADLIRDELNVKAVRFLSDEDGMTLYRLTPVFAKLGAKLKGDMQAVKEALTTADQAQAAAWGRLLLANMPITLEVNGKHFTLQPDEVEVRQEAAEGFIVFEERGYVAVLDVTLTPELVNERIAREVVRRIQTLRKNANLELSDRIVIHYQASPRLVEAINAFADYVQRETLARDMQCTQPDAGFIVEDFTESLKGELDGETLTVGIQRVS